MATLYLAEDLHPDAFAPGRRLVIRGQEARHAAQVVRVRTGDRIAIGDGRGRLAWGAVTGSPSHDEVAILVEEVLIETPRHPALWLVQALAKGDRGELAVQAATEIGAAGIVPWAAKRSVTRWDGPKAGKGVERWRAVAREATKQSIRPSIPEVDALASTADVAALPGLLLVLDPDAEPRLAEAPLAGAERVNLVIGPEGGLDPAELEAFAAAGAVTARMGTEVLRTSTAGPAALAALSVILGRW